MKAISLWQPWASLIAEGVKKTETRSWPAPEGIVAGLDRIAIHAAKRWDGEVIAAVKELWEPLFGDKELPLGRIVATCSLCHVYRTDSPGWYNNQDVMDSRPYGDYGPGRYIWLLRDIRKLEKPLEIRGRQGFFNICNID